MYAEISLNRKYKKKVIKPENIKINFVDIEFKLICVLKSLYNSSKKVKIRETAAIPPAKI
jgi:hypothetical protein